MGTVITMSTNSYKFSSPVYLLITFIVGSVITFVLSLYFDQSCGIDQCRYVDIEDAKLFYDVHNGFSGTKFVFMFYTLSQISEFQYFIALVLNYFIVCITAYIVGIDFTRQNLLIPFIVPYIFLAGKEIFIFIGLFLCFASVFYTRNIIYRSFVLLLGVGLIGTVRAEFIIVFAFMLFAYNFVMKGNYYYRFMYSVIAIVTISFVMVIFKNGYTPSAALYEPSSIPYVRELRIATSGFGITESIMRFFLYLIYMIATPFIEVIRLFMLKSLSPTILISISSIVMPYFIYRKFGVEFMISSFVLISLTLAPIFGFIHTRYLFPMMYFFYLYKELDNIKNERN